MKLVFRAVKCDGKFEDWIYPWMAAFVDSEGWIGIRRQLRENRPNPSYSAQLKLSNQKGKGLKICSLIYGGDVHKYPACYQWVCPSSSLRRFLLDVGPFLILKRKQAELIFNFIKAVERQKKRRSLAVRTVTTREWYYQRAKTLNKHWGWVKSGAD
jgi:hypothetical protein